MRGHAVIVRLKTAIGYVQGWTIRPFPDCENVAGKLRQMIRPSLDPYHAVIVRLKTAMGYVCSLFNGRACCIDLMVSRGFDFGRLAMG